MDMENFQIDPRLNRMTDKIYLLPLEEKAALLKTIYKKKMGSELNLDNPVTFSEKVQWYKLYYNHPDLWRCVDKVECKSYVAEKIGEGHTAKLLRVFHSPDEVCFDDLPNQFVVKSNCQDNCTYVVLVKDKNNFDFESLTDEIKKYWFNPLNLIVNGFSNAYRDVKPKVLVEEYINEELPDYKMFCFGGKPEFLYVSQRDLVEGSPVVSSTKITFFDVDWNMMDVSLGKFSRNPNAVKPHHLQEMIEAAKVLSAEFPLVRVDFYDTPEQFYIGELTIYPSSGLDPFKPESFDRYMGDLFKLDLG